MVGGLICASRLLLLRWRLRSAVSDGSRNRVGAMQSGSGASQASGSNGLSVCVGVCTTNLAWEILVYGLFASLGRVATR